MTPFYKLILLCFLTPMFPLRLHADQEKLTVAVSYFDNTSDDRSLDSLRKGLADMLITDLSKLESLRIVEREKFESLVREIKLNRGAFFDPKTAQKLGKGLGAQFVLTGSYLLVDDDLRIDVRLIRVETGEVILADKASGQRVDFFDIEKELVGLLIESLGLKLDRNQKRAVSVRSTTSFDAVRLYGMGLDASDAGERDKAVEAFRAALAKDPAFKAAESRLALIENRVTSLEQGGGLITTPNTWNEHLGNFNVYSRRQQFKEASAELASAIAVSPRLFDLWEFATQLPSIHRPHPPESIPKELHPIIDAFIKGDRRRLANMQEGASPESLVAIDMFRLMLAASRKVPTYTDLLHARAAVGRLDLPTLQKYSFEPNRRMDAYAELRQRWSLDRGDLSVFRWDQRFVFFEDESSCALPVCKHGTHVGGFGGAQRGGSPFILLNVWLPEQPAPGNSPIRVTLDRDRSHPGWKESARPYGGRYPTPDEFDAPPKPNAFLFRPITPIVKGGGDVSDPLNRGYPLVAEFGKEVPMHVEEWECLQGDSLKIDKLPTQSMCGIRLALDKALIPPGPYKITVSYSDKDNVPVVITGARAWVHEFLIASISNDFEESVAAWPTEAEDPAFNKYWSPARGPKKRAWAAAICWFPQDGGADVPSGYYRPAPSVEPRIFYDWDYGVFRGDRRKLDLDDTAEWLRYRKELITGGASVRARNDCAYLALPDLSPGLHQVCLVAQFEKGAASFEPECYAYTIPER